MPCNCNKSTPKTTIYQVSNPQGSKSFSTESQAKLEVAKNGGSYRTVTK